MNGFIAVAGTTPYDPATQKLLYPEDAGKQAIVTLAEIIQAIKSVGSKRSGGRHKSQSVPGAK